jgi:hypothetical protein
MYATAGEMTNRDVVVCIWQRDVDAVADSEAVSLAFAEHLAVGPGDGAILTTAVDDSVTTATLNCVRSTSSQYIDSVTRRM